MDRNITFSLPTPYYTIVGLDLDHAPQLLPLFEACSDFVWMERGEPATMAVVLENFTELPTHRTMADKFVFGVQSANGAYVGILECNRGYSTEGSWWIGLYMLDPAVRGTGIAHTVLQAFAEWVQAQGGNALELAVITTNERACRFWQAQGFTITRTTELYTFGAHQHRLHVMRRAL